MFTTNAFTKYAWVNIAIRVVAVCLLVVLIYAGYLGLIGIPRTKARELYNQARLDFVNEDYAGSLAKLNQAQALWAEGYIIEFKQTVQRYHN